MPKKKSSLIDQAVELGRAMHGANSLSSEENEALVRLATDIINRDYWDDVRGVTNDLIGRIKDGEIKDREGLDQALDEAVDGTQRVMYTFQAKLGLLATENEDAWENDFGEKPEDESKAMFAAMRQDVQAQLDAEDVDRLLEEEEED